MIPMEKALVKDRNKFSRLEGYETKMAMFPVIDVYSLAGVQQN
jgi:hypothetical protein